MAVEATHSLDRTINYSQDDVLKIQETGLDVRANQIYLFGHPNAEAPDNVDPGVDFLMAHRFIINLNILMRKSLEPILIHLNSCGGFEDMGYAIYWAIKSCPNHVTILNYASARSMSSLIFLAADKKVMLPYSTFMYHTGTFSMEGTTTQAITEIEELQKGIDKMLDIYVDTLKQNGSKKDWTKPRLKKWLKEQMDKKEDVYLSAEEAVEIGFADEIFGPDKYDWGQLLKYG